jgi:hypothetical protein
MPLVVSQANASAAGKYAAYVSRAEPHKFTEINLIFDPGASSQFFCRQVFVYI